MRLLIIDACANALDLAVRAQWYGHEVKLFLRNLPKHEYIGQGFCQLVDDFKPWLRWANIVFVADNTLYLRDLDAARREGMAIVGCSSDMAEWELDRQEGCKILTEHGVECPQSVEFSNYDKAMNHVKKEMKRFVSKPSGDADKALSYCSTGPDDMCYMLERWKKSGKLKPPFLLQEFIDGIEFAVGAWCGPDGFQTPFCENFEFKKLCVGDLGVATGEQGTVLRYVDKSKLAEHVLQPLESTLIARGYIGYIDVNCIIDHKGTPWPLEFTTRPGWPTFNIQEPLHEGDPVQWLMDLYEGKAPPCKTSLLSTGVVLSIPDYPYSHTTQKEVVGVPIYGITPSLLDHIHPCEMKVGMAPKQVGNKIEEALTYQTAGDYVLVMTATGDTVQGTRETVYRRLKRLKVPNSPMYRTDIGVRLKRQLPELQTMGYAKGMTYALEP